MSSASRAHGNLNERAESKARVRSRGGPAMDWPRPQPESSYLWDQVPQLRCYLYDPTSSHISTSLSRSLSSRFSFSPSLSFSLSPFPPPLSPCRSLAPFLRSYSLPALCFASSFHFHSVPRYLSSTLLLRALYPPGRSSRYLPAARFAFFKVIYPPADALSRMPDRRTSISAKAPSRICAITCFRSHAR